MEDTEGTVHIVESDKEIKRGTYYKQRCSGYSNFMSKDEKSKCKKCGYKIVRVIDEVEPYSFKNSRGLKIEPGIKTLEELFNYF